MPKEKISMKDIIDFIDATSNPDTLNTINRLVISRSRQIRANAIAVARGEFRVNDRVVFSDRKGNEIHGSIVAIKNTSAIVLDDVRNFFPDTPRKWRVGLDLLRPEEVNHSRDLVNNIISNQGGDGGRLRGFCRGSRRG